MFLNGRSLKTNAQTVKSLFGHWFWGTPVQKRRKKYFLNQKHEKSWFWDTTFVVYSTHKQCQQNVGKSDAWKKLHKVFTWKIWGRKIPHEQDKKIFLKNVYETSWLYQLSECLWEAVAPPLLVRLGCPDTQMIRTRSNSFISGVYPCGEPRHHTPIVARSGEKPAKSSTDHLHRPMHGGWAREIWGLFSTRTSTR